MSVARGGVRNKLSGDGADWQQGLQGRPPYNINNRPGSAASVLSETPRPTKLDFGPVGTDEVDSDGGGQEVTADDDGALPEAANAPPPTGEELPRAPGDEARKIKGELFTLCCSFNSICSRVQMALLPEV